jgi:hypothetical protein
MLEIPSVPTSFYSEMSSSGSKSELSKNNFDLEDIKSKMSQTKRESYVDVSY